MLHVRSRACDSSHFGIHVLETCQSDWVLDKVRMTSEEIKQCQDLVRLYNSREAASMLAVNIKGLPALKPA